jgi:Sec-independent protein secretion pathway component TatC
MFSVSLLVLGALFGHTTAYPAALDFLIGYGSQFRPTITIGVYTYLFLTIIFGLALVFELPVVMGLLGALGIVSASWLWRNLRYTILVISIVCRNHHPDRGHPEHVHVCCPNGRVIHAEYRDCLSC